MVDKLDQERREALRTSTPPYTVVLTDRFTWPGDPDECSDLGKFETFEIALVEASKFSLTALRQFESLKLWRGMGEGALIFDSRGKLVWSAFYDLLRDPDEPSGAPAP